MPARTTPFRAAVHLQCLASGCSGRAPVLCTRPSPAAAAQRRPFHGTRSLRDDIDDRNHYETLNVQPNASAAEIKKCVRFLSTSAISSPSPYHPFQIRPRSSQSLTLRKILLHPLQNPPPGPQSRRSPRTPALHAHLRSLHDALAHRLARQIRPRRPAPPAAGAAAAALLLLRAKKRRKLPLHTRSGGRAPRLGPLAPPWHLSRPAAEFLSQRRMGRAQREAWRRTRGEHWQRQ